MGGPAPGTGRPPSTSCRPAELRDAGAGRRACCSARTRSSCCGSGPACARASTCPPSTSSTTPRPRRRADTRHPLADRSDLPLVHVTHFNELIWDCGRAPTPVVEHGVVDPGYRWTGELDSLAVVVNEPVRRCRVTGTDLWCACPRSRPVDVYGMGMAALAERAPHLAGGLHEDLPQHAMHAELGPAARVPAPVPVDHARPGPDRGDDSRACRCWRWPPPRRRGRAARTPACVSTDVDTLVRRPRGGWSARPGARPPGSGWRARRRRPRPGTAGPLPRRLGPHCSRR